MATATETATEEWVLKAEARRRLRIGTPQLNALMASGSLRTRQIPGSFTRINLNDIERLLAESIRRPADSPVAVATH